MAGSTRNRRPHGRTVRCAGGYRAFLPAPLPPPIEWSSALAAALSHADLAVGRLAGVRQYCSLCNRKISHQPRLNRNRVGVAIAP